MKRLTLLTLTALAGLCVQGAAHAAEPVALKVIAVESSAGQVVGTLDGVVEAVRQTTLSTQVAGAVVALHVKAGDKVKAGQALAVMEAMKMEHTLTAPFTGVVRELLAQAGGQALKGALLLQIEAVAA